MKDIKKLSNTEIKKEMAILLENYEETKAKIISLYDKLDEMDKEYMAAEEELKIRLSIINSSENDG